MAYGHMDRARIQRMATTALLGSLALLLSYIETMIPLPFAVPGIKLGLANATVLVALFALDVRSAAAVALIKVLASGFLFGTPTMLAYSAGGTAAALAAMVLCQRALKLGCVPVSMASAICHNAGQLAVAAAMLGSSAVFLTLPPLAVAACLTGALIGCVAGGVVDALQVGEAERKHVDLSGLELAAGEHVAFVGANGSGKTTAALQLAGLAEGCSGEARLVFQDPDDQLVSSIAQDDVAFGCENLGIELAEMRRLVAEALDEVGAGELALHDVTKLSGGQRQRVAIAGVLAMNPKLVVFDEATSMQDAAGRARFAELVARLKARGVTVVTVTQVPAEATRADRVALFEGCVLAEIMSGDEYARRVRSLQGLETYRVSSSSSVILSARPAPCAQNDRAGEANRWLGAAGIVDPGYRAGGTPCAACAGFDGGASQQTTHVVDEAPASPGLRLKGVCYCYPGASRPVLSGVDLTIAPGRIVGLAGPSGAGKSTLAQIAAGYLVPTAGTVAFESNSLTARSNATREPAAQARQQQRQATQAFRIQVALVGQAPERALFATTAFEDVMFGARTRALDEEAATAAAEEALRCVGIDPQEAREKSPFSFSGGEKRRIALAGMLVLDTPYLILDEPDAGLDPREVARLEALLTRLRAQGKGILLISHNDAFLRACCDGLVELPGRKALSHAAGQSSPASEPDLTKQPAQTPAFGIYQPGNTLMHRLNPLVKLVGCALFMVAGFLASSWTALGLAALVCAGALAAARATPLQALAALRPFVLLMVFVGIFDLLFAGGGEIWWKVGPVSLSSGGALFAVQSVLRFALVALGTSTLMRTTSATQLSDACSLLLAPLAKLGMHPENLSLSLGMTLRFIPLVQEEFACVKRAQEARLTNFNASSIAARLKSYIPVFTPLFASCLRRSSALALAIENRAYGCEAKRTRFRSYPVRAIDGVAVAVVVALLIAAVAL